MLCSDQPFQVFAKPVGARCNLSCTYCYYLSKQALAGQGAGACMSDALLERYICQHIEACIDSVIQFSWHGGEPRLFGLDGFKRIVDLQKKHCPKDRQIVNGIQTNGTLLDEAWYEFLAKESWSVGLSLDGPAVFHDQCRVMAQGQPTCGQVLEAYERLRKHGIATEILCVVHACIVAR